MMRRMEAEVAEDSQFALMAKIRQARRLTPGAKFRAGGELFEEACQWTLAGIASRSPEFTEAERLQELRRRLQLADRLG